MTAAAITIRDAGLEDVPGVAALERQLTGRYSPEYWRELLSTFAYPILTFCAEAGDTLVGVLVAQVRIGEQHLAGEVGWVTSIGVATEWQRCGVARALLTAATARMAELGVSEVWALTLAETSIAGFLGREGFAARHDLVPMRLEIRTAT